MSLQKESEWEARFDKHFWGVTKLGKHPQGWEIIDGPMEELMKDVKSFIESLLEQERESWEKEYPRYREAWKKAKKSIINK